MFSTVPAASTTERPELLIVNKSNINVLLAHKWCLLSFYFIFSSKGLNRHQHGVAVGVQRHPTQPNASKPPQNNMVATGFTTFRSGSSLEVASHLKRACIQMVKSVSSPFTALVLIEQAQD